MTKEEGNENEAGPDVGDKEKVLKVRRFKEEIKEVLERAKANKEEPDKTKLDLNALNGDREKSEQFWQRLPELDDGVPHPDYIPVAEKRRQANLPFIPPSEVKVLVLNCLRATRYNLASALEAHGNHRDALNIYQRLLDQGVTMREVMWDNPAEIRLSLNNVAVCARRARAEPQAGVWYKNGLQLCRYENPGCEEEAFLRHNYETFLGGPLGGPPQGITESGGQDACWACGATPTPEKKLLKCSKCTEGGHLFIIGKYCSKECQIEDWKKRHKKYHKKVAPVAEIMAQENPEKVEVNVNGFVNNETIPGAYMYQMSPRPV